jgi:hypothetical protein
MAVSGAGWTRAAEPLDLLCYGLVPARRQCPGFNARGVLLHGFWPHHIDRQHHDRLLFPGKFQHRESRTGRAAKIRFRWPVGFLCLTAVGRCQCFQVRTSNAIPAHPIAQRPTADTQEACCLHHVAACLDERLTHPCRLVQGFGLTTDRRCLRSDGMERSRQAQLLQRGCVDDDLRA